MDKFLLNAFRYRLHMAPEDAGGGELGAPEPEPKHEPPAPDDSFSAAEEAARKAAAEEAKRRAAIEQAARALNYLQTEFDSDYNVLEAQGRAVVDMLKGNSYASDVEKAETLRRSVATAYLKYQQPQLEGMTASFAERVTAAKNGRGDIYAVYKELREAEELARKAAQKTGAAEALKTEAELKTMTAFERAAYHAKTDHYAAQKRRNDFITNPENFGKPYRG
jgi:septal ring factor EnvC (AmiA/AmiB activator)